MHLVIPLNPRRAHNPMETQCNQSQYPNLRHNFALSQFIAQHNCEDLDPTNNPSAVPTSLEASSDLTKVWHIAHFWVSYGRCAMPGSPMGWSE